MLNNYKSLFNDNLFIEAVKAKKVCLFLGSGVGFNIGMPDWLGLAKEICSFCLKNKIINRSEQINLMNMKNPIKIISICTQKIKNKNKIAQFNLLLKTLFYNNPMKKYRKNEIYKNLSKLYKEKAVLIVQTNYDVILEKFQSKEEGGTRNIYIPYLNEEAIPEKNILNFIIYLHGRFSGDETEFKRSSYETLVLDKEQYNKVYILQDRIECQKQKDFLNYLLKEFFIVFLGYSLSDTEILHMIANKQKTEQYKQIAVIVDDCEAKKLENEFNANYLNIASNGKISTFVYETNHSGIEKGFCEVIENLTQEILIKPKINKPILKYTNPEEVDFG